MGSWRHQSSSRRNLADDAHRRRVQPVSDLLTAIPHRQQTILVVEDDPALLAFYKSALVIAGFTVLTAGDGLDALHKIEARMPEVPDLIVLDIGLPRLSGRDVRQEIAAHAHTRHIPIVVVTGQANVDASDYNCVLTKPVDADSLVTAVEDCLRQARR